MFQLTIDLCTRIQRESVAWKNKKSNLVAGKSRIKWQVREEVDDDDDDEIGVGITKSQRMQSGQSEKVEETRPQSFWNGHK